MLIQELLAESTARFDKKRNSPMGDSKEWLEKMGITKDMFPSILKKARASSEYKTLIKDGWKDVTTEAAEKRGTIQLRRTVPHGRREVALNVGIQVWGKANFSHGTDFQFNRWPASTGKPRVVVGKPEESALTSMKQTFERIHELTLKDNETRDKKQAKANGKGQAEYPGLETPSARAGLLNARHGVRKGDDE